MNYETLNLSSMNWQVNGQGESIQSIDSFILYIMT